MKLCVVLILTAMLCGCGSQTAMETVADAYIVPAAAEPREIRVELPGEMLACVMESDAGRIYLGDTCEAVVQTVTSGDLDATLTELTGFPMEDLTILQTRDGDVRRWEFAWAAAGETGDRLGRGVILDDGEYHYCLSILEDAQAEAAIAWNEVFRSFDLT